MANILESKKLYYPLAFVAIRHQTSFHTCWRPQAKRFHQAEMEEAVFLIAVRAQTA